MNVETIVNYMNVYGYFIIFLCLYLGIVGIPAPEESLLFLIGVLIGQHQLEFGAAVLYANLGAFAGMMTGYFIGKKIGYPFIHKYGKYIGITNERWEKAKYRYEKNVQKSILLGFYMPGLRQISPYFAGIANIPFRKYIMCSLIGTLIWINPFILGGYYIGQYFSINPDYVPYVGVLFLLVFVLYVLFKQVKKKVKKRIHN
ncbi:DedA family protein [Niallia sp. 03133]|uniref:DedA family protein n=1 Tax=Niallia sp. 03133 TaxID=3458060 RepID=UPI0040446A11